MEAHGDMVIDEIGNEVKKRFSNFIMESQEAEENENTTLAQRLLLDYRAQILNMIQNDKTTLFVDFQHVSEFDHELMEGLHTYSCTHKHTHVYTYYNIRTFLHENVQTDHPNRYLTSLAAIEMEYYRFEPQLRKALQV